MSLKKIISFTGPRGSGKSALVDGVINIVRNAERITSNTTRLSRKGDVTGEYRHSALTDLEWQERDGLVAWKAQYDRYWYWTLNSDIEKALAISNYSLIIVVPEIVPLLMAIAPERVLPIWVTPPPKLEHDRRLKIRGEIPEKRKAALKEADEWQPSPDIPYQIVYNDGELPATLQQLGRICRKEGLEFIPR